MGQAEEYSMAGSIVLLLREGREGLGLGLGIPLWGLLLLCGRGNGLVVPFTGVDVLGVGLDAPISVVVVESDLHAVN